MNINYDDAIPVTRDIHWVGFYDKEAELHCNPYLMIDQDEAILFDPGSIPHFSIVMRKVIDLINPAVISHIVCHHQDPDVCGNLAVIEDVISRNDLKIVAHPKSIRLIRHYGVRSEFFDIAASDFELKLKSGRQLKFLQTPFLHAPGAFATLDTSTNSLFSCDLFGAVSKEWMLFNDKDILNKMRTFHELYMPSNNVLKSCMHKLRKLDIKRILPQHGSVLENTQVNEAIDFLETLPCGIDLSEINREEQ